MNFARALEPLAAFLEDLDARWAVIGGVALAAYGHLRTTLDLDLVLEAKIQQRLVAFLESRGYRTLHCSSGYSNHLHDDPLLGRLDFVFVDPETAEKLFAATRWLKGPHERPIPVAAPEHLVAMKVMALKNDPSRSELERADLRFLLRQPGVDLDYARSLFARHGLEATYDELREAT